MTLGPDLLLDEDDHDLVFEGGDLVMKVDLRQAIKIAILFVRGEWFLKRDEGVPYYESIFVKDPNLDHVASFFRAAILGVPGVRSILEFSLDLDRGTRTLIVDWKCDTDEGEIGSITPVEFPS